MSGICKRGSAGRLLSQMMSCSGASPLCFGGPDGALDFPAYERATAADRRVLCRAVASELLARRAVRVLAYQ